MRTLTTLLLTLGLVGGIAFGAQPPTADQVRTGAEFCQQVNYELVLNVETGLQTQTEAQEIMARCTDIYVK